MDNARQKKPTSTWTFTRKRLDTIPATVLARRGTAPGKRRSDRRCCACSYWQSAFLAQPHAAVTLSLTQPARTGFLRLHKDNLGINKQSPSLALAAIFARILVAVYSALV